MPTQNNRLKHPVHIDCKLSPMKRAELRRKARRLVKRNAKRRSKRALYRGVQ